MYLTKSRLDITTAVSFGTTKSTSPTQDDYNQLYYIVEYIIAMADKSYRIYIGTSSAIQQYCEVDASYLIHSDSKGHSGYTMGLHPIGTFYNRSAKQTLVSTSSTHNTEMRAVYTLVKDILFIIYICSKRRAQHWESNLPPRGNFLCPRGHLFICAPGSPFYAPGSLSCDQGTSFCALGSTFCAPHHLLNLHLILTYFFENIAQRLRIR
jgi:hypothetical protein